ncbi:MAG: hypothetical protein ABIG40_03450 [Parcubacteria group bacterium]
MITLISITTIISGSAYLLSGFYVFFSWRKGKNLLLQTFATFLLGTGIQMFFLTLGLAVFFDNPLMSNISWWIAHIFMLVATGSLLLLPVSIKFPTKKQLIRKIIILYLVIGGLILLLNLPKVELFISPDNIINWRVPGLSTAVIAVFAGVVSLFSAYVFISESFKIENGLMKFRSIFLGLGILSFFIGGPMHNFVTNFAMAAVAASLSVLGVLLILAGIYIPAIFKKSPQENSPETNL